MIALYEESAYMKKDKCKTEGQEVSTCNLHNKLKCMDCLMAEIDRLRIGIKGLTSIAYTAWCAAWEAASQQLIN